MMTKEEKTARSEARKQERKDKKSMTEIEAMKNQKPVDRVTITIEWSKSRIWGSNPRATANVAYKDGSFGNVGPFTCSGSGYDKESTVIAAVFNAVLLYKLFLSISGEAPYGVSYHGGEAPKETYEDKQGVKHSYYCIPYYNGAIGTNCYYRIAEFIGGTFTHVASGKMFDVYEYKDEKTKKA